MKNKSKITNSLHLKYFFSYKMGCMESTEKIIDPLHVNLTHFTIERVIGQGGFGKVNACVHKPTYINYLFIFHS